MIAVCRLEDIPGKLEELIKLLKEKGYASQSLELVSNTVKALQKYMDANGLDEYRYDVSQQFFDCYFTEHDCSEKYKKGIKTSLRRFDDYVSGRGYVPVAVRPHKTCPPEYSDLLEEFLHSCQENGNKEVTIDVKRTRLIPFLEGLVNIGCTSCENITPESIGQALRGTLSSSWSTIASFFRYLATNDYLLRDYSLIIPKSPSGYKLPTVYSEEEIAQTLASVDRNTNNGKMDYCMLLFASRLGMRAGDIVSIKLSNLHLDEGRVTWVAQKNSEPMDLYISSDMVDALRDYIVNVRPDSSEDYLFLNLRAPHGPYVPKAVYYRTQKYLNKASIDVTGKKQGPHAFRSSMGSSLVNNGESYNTVRDINGHRDKEAIKHYVKLDITNLRKCAEPVPSPCGFFERFLNGEVTLS